MGRMPGWGIFKGMAFGLKKFFEPKVTVQYPEERVGGPPRGRGRLLLLYDEFGALKCETCFQCAMACPIEVIDMGGVDTKNRHHLHWGPPEQYAERRVESALRRSGRVVPDRSFDPWQAIDLQPLDRILAEEDYSPRRMLRILERAQDAYGHLPVAALQHISHQTGAWYSELYGIATSYPSLRLEPPTGHSVAVCRCAACTVAGGGRVMAAFEEALGASNGGLSPDGAVRLTTAQCHGSTPGRPYVTVDGEPLPQVSPEDAATIAAAMRGHVAQGRPA